MKRFIVLALLAMGNISLGAKRRDFQKRLKSQEIRLKIIEGKLDLFESKQDIDNDIISKIFERLAIMESYLNDTRIDSRTDLDENGNKHDLYSHEASLNSHEFAETDTGRIIEAFHQEKMLNKFLREEISELQNTLGGQYKVVAQIEDDLESLRNASSTIKTLPEQTNGVLSDMITNFGMLNSSIDYLTLQMDGVEKTAEMAFNICQKVENQQPASCKEVYEDNTIRSGVYTVYPGDQKFPVRVFCDMETDGGGWTVFQRRKDGSEDFFRRWKDYKRGFGELEGEFWLGNQVLGEMTAGCCYELRIDLEDFEGNKAYAKYGKFQVLPEAHKYKLVVDDYSGDAGDSLSGHSGQNFSTKDRDMDAASTANCADLFKGGWWYKRCHDSNLNGLYLHGINNQAGKGVVWYHWKMTNKYSLKKTEMKFRKL